MFNLCSSLEGISFINEKETRIDKEKFEKGNFQQDSETENSFYNNLKNKNSTEEKQEKNNKDSTNKEDSLERNISSFNNLDILKWKTCICNEISHMFDGC